MTTGLELPGLAVRENLGVCYGIVVRSMGSIGGMVASFKALRRGEIREYTQLLEDSRRHAIDRMVENARLMDADAIIAVRFDSSEIGRQFTEIVAYGTAVKVGPRPSRRSRAARATPTGRRCTRSSSATRPKAGCRSRSSSAGSRSSRWRRTGDGRRRDGRPAAAAGRLPGHARPGGRAGAAATGTPTRRRPIGSRRVSAFATRSQTG